MVCNTEYMCVVIFFKFENFVFFFWVVVLRLFLENIFWSTFSKQKNNHFIHKENDNHSWEKGGYLNFLVHTNIQDPQLSTPNEHWVVDLRGQKRSIITFYCGVKLYSIHLFIKYSN